LWSKLINCNWVRYYGYREEQIAKLQSGHQYDVLVIGGGATGTGVALDAATRGNFMVQNLQIEPLLLETLKLSLVEYYN